MISIDTCVITRISRVSTIFTLLCIVDTTTITVYVVETSCTISDSVANLITISIRVATRVFCFSIVVTFYLIGISIIITI